MTCNCECDDGKLGPWLGFLHMSHSDSKPFEHIERCDSCKTLPDDAAARELHRRVCGCGYDKKGARP